MDCFSILLPQRPPPLPAAVRLVLFDSPVAMPLRCFRGHEMTGANLYVDMASSKRRCRACQAIRLSRGGKR